MRLARATLILTLLFLLPFNGNASTQRPPATHLYPIVWKWFSGRIDSSYYFNEFSHPNLINNLKDAHQVKRAREFWYAKNLDSFNSGHWNWLGVSNFLGRFQTIRGIYRAGTDMVEQTIGGFTVHVSPKGKDSIEFTLHDIKSRWSLFFHLPFIKNIEFDGNKTIQRNMTNTHWWFKWTEPIHTALFHQRSFNQKFKNRKKYSGHYF